LRILGLRIVCLWLAIAMCGGSAHGQQSAGQGDATPATPAQAPASGAPPATAPAGSQAPAAPATATQTGQTPPADEKEKEIEKKEQSQRALGIYPQFAVTSRQNAPPLTPGGKFHLFYKTAFDPFEFILAGIQAGSDQAEDEFPAYGEGAKGLGKRYAADFGDTVSSNFFSNYFYSVLLKEDPRYFRLGVGTFRHRFLYSLEQEFMCHTDKGHRTFNFQNVLGAISSGALSNTYHPQADRGVGLTARGTAFGLAYGSLGGLISEFWPDINARMHKRQKESKPPANAASPTP